MTQEIRFLTPKLYDANGDLTKEWFVFYSFLNPKTRKLVRFKIKKGINKGQTIETRRNAARVIITNLNQDLLNGFNPFNKTYVKEKVQCNQFYLSNVIISYFNRKKENLRKKTISTYKTKVYCFAEWLDKNYPELETENFDENIAREFVDYIKNQKKSNTTVNSYFITLKTIFNEMVKEDLFVKNPFFKIKKYQETRQGKLPFKEFHKETLKTMISDECPQLWLFIQFIYYCFIRPGELRLLKIEAINVDNSTIVIDANISKNKKTQYVAIPNPLLNLIKEKKLHTYPDNYYLFGRNGVPGPEPRKQDYFNKTHKRITEKLGLGNRFALYSWKSTGAVDAVRAGLGLKDIQLQLRHSSLEMTDIYLKSIGVLDNKAIMNLFPVL